MNRGDPDGVYLEGHSRVAPRGARSCTHDQRSNDDSVSERTYPKIRLKFVLNVARAYDQAARLLRGSKARTNFRAHAPSDSPLASRIRCLLNNERGVSPDPTKEDATQVTDVDAAANPTTASSDINNISSSSHCSTDSSTSSISHEDAYRPDMSHWIEDFALASGCGLVPRIDRFSYTQEVPPRDAAEQHELSGSDPDCS